MPNRRFVSRFSRWKVHLYNNMDILFRKRFSKAVDKTLFQNLARERRIRTIRKTIDYSRMNRLFETYSKEGGGKKSDPTKGGDQRWSFWGGQANKPRGERHFSIANAHTPTHTGPALNSDRARAPCGPLFSSSYAANLCNPTRASSAYL